MAGVRWVGDTPKVKSLERKFQEVASKRFRSRLNRQLAEEALELTRDGFNRSITPYGVRWKNPRYRTGQPLRLTRRLESSIRPISSAERFELLTNVVYAATHQYGRDAIPQRQFMPIGSRGFGGRWRRALEEVYRREIHAAMGR